LVWFGFRALPPVLPNTVRQPPVTFWVEIRSARRINRGFAGLCLDTPAALFRGIFSPALMDE
jgi:hypothetical protein